MAVMSAGVAFVRSPSQDAASQGLPPSPRPSLFSGSFRDGGLFSPVPPVLVGFR